jgi:signal transduction histidine kinase
VVEADPNRLQQLLENLFRNSVEHSSTSPDSQARQDAVEHGRESTETAEVETDLLQAMDDTDCSTEGAHCSGDPMRDGGDGIVDDSGHSVRVKVGAVPAGDGTAGGFYVADDGPGIPPDERDHVFESGYSNAEDGTGFGLAIVDQIVTAHDWEVAVTHSEWNGARFEITDVEQA